MACATVIRAEGRTEGGPNADEGEGKNRTMAGGGSQIETRKTIKTFTKMSPK